MSDILPIVDSDVEQEIRTVPILILETDPDTRELLKLKLELTGFTRVLAFDEPDDMLAHMGKGAETSLLLLDVLHTDAAWFRTARTMMGEGRRFPTIIITALSSPEEITTILASGAADVIVKPFDMGIFVLKVEKVLTEYFYDRNLSEAYARNERLFLNILQVMAGVIEARFPYVQFHSENVARYARLLGTMSGLTADRIRLIGTAGVLHDLGKIGVREDILNKPGPLTPEEYEIVKLHPVIASEVLNPISEMNIVLRDVRHHHEWYNGQGYPDCIRGEDIPVGARILHIAEAYETMIGQRVYKAAYPKDRAIQELIDFRGTQFDPDLVDLFIDYLRK